MGEAAVPVIHSAAWDSASSPVLAVSRLGSVSVSSGSTKASAGVTKTLHLALMSVR
jgi:hypothetical protein